MADWLVEGLTATISGVLTVFAVLILISIIISLLKYVEKINLKTIFKSDKKAEVEKVVVVTTDVPVEEKIQDDLELVAVITASIAAMLGTSSDQLQVRSIKRVQQPNRAWQRR